MLFSILGPDGTGKTTLAINLAKKTEGLEYVYFGNNQESRKYKYFKKYLKHPGKGKFYTFFKYFFIFINDLSYYHKAKHINVISDRNPIDKFVGTKIHKLKWRNYYHSFLLKFFPNPELTILLVGDPKTIYLRKREISIEIIQQQIVLYKNYLIDNKIKHIIIDTTDKDIKETYKIAKKEINKFIS